MQAATDGGAAGKGHDGNADIFETSFHVRRHDAVFAVCILLSRKHEEFHIPCLNGGEHAFFLCIGVVRCFVLVVFKERVIGILVDVTGYAVVAVVGEEVIF